MTTPPDRPPEPPRATPPAPQPENSGHKDIERRLDSLEQSLADLRRNQIEGHKWFITVIFSLVALLLALLGISSRSDVREAIRDMKSDVNNSTSSMEKRFAELAGEAIKKPDLQMSTKRGTLNGEKIKVGYNQNPLYPLFVKNSGDKTSDSLSIRLYASSALDISRGAGTWVTFESDDKFYPVGYYYTFPTRSSSPHINPQETWTLDNSGDVMPVDAIYPMTTNRLIDCKLLIFYGAEKPAEADFRLDYTEMH